MTSKLKLNPKAAEFVFSGDFGAAPAAAPAAAASPASPQSEQAAAGAAGAAAPAKKAEPKKQWDDEDAVEAKVKDLSIKAETPKAEAKAETPKAAEKPASSPPAKKAEAKAEAKPKAEPKAEAPVESKKKKGVEYKVHDTREHLNIVFIGHVDAGKSTISGQIMLLTGQVDERTMAKYEREAKEKNRESWYLAYIMDTNEEERAKGKTVEVGRAHFASKNKRYTMLDCPGHKNYVPNMIGGTAQADVGILVISARKGEFETGFEKGGQTREHAMLAKTLGIRRMIILVNKMDDPTVQWSQERFKEVEEKLTPFLKQWGYNVEKECTFLPASGYTGANLAKPVAADVCPWWKGRPLMEILDTLPPLERDDKAPVRIPIITRYKDMGVLYVLGKVESGTVNKDAELVLMPNNKKVQCAGLLVEDEEVDVAKPGENVHLKIKGVEEEECIAGFVLSAADKPCRRSKEFEAQVVVLPLLEHKPIITAGYQCVLHIHSLAVECAITTLLAEVDKKTGKPGKKPTFMKSGGIMTCRISTEDTIAVESFKDFPQMGRFTLRDEGKTIGIGKILRIKDYNKDKEAQEKKA